VNRFTAPRTGYNLSCFFDQVFDESVPVVAAIFRASHGPANFRCQDERPEGASRASWR
jgi:hypothetical protein